MVAYRAARLLAALLGPNSSMNTAIVPRDSDILLSETNSQSGAKKLERVLNCCPVVNSIH